MEIENQPRLKQNEFWNQIWPVSYTIACYKCYHMCSTYSMPLKWKQDTIAWGFSKMTAQRIYMHLRDDTILVLCVPVSWFTSCPNPDSSQCRSGSWRFGWIFTIRSCSWGPCKAATGWGGTWTCQVELTAITLWCFVDGKVINKKDPILAHHWGQNRK